ncbi:MAG: bifunctional methylenetetrahydrofolate dehydrogenase/methenyltetrahydrofolate cyclohydrolase FolD [Erysipelotrichaceae bacterium]|nr:bifunctional methylenetetrahydrofolate dehydrogenase/methenyltetrahydrofolate cyclohydrolase FolD [Erysipelotrichaceae bacterium]MDP3305749.1 bifunctional methylenetetrahydrofolate dehydrogenase/methenyltetrahydrofolate cyclohydrolase FolD [Erysipelotrichaceae bacterium]
MSEILDGKWLSSTIREELKEKVDQLKGVRLPKLVVVLVGDDPASHTYVNAKEKACKDVGFVSKVHRLTVETTNEELLALIQSLNEDETVDGILVQMPIPKHLDSKAVIMAIDPEKDVDGFHPINVGKLHSNERTFVPCTPLGVMKLLEAYNIDVAGMNTVVLGRSHLVGRPIAQLLVNANATVTICHSRSKHIDEICRRADLIVAAVGVPHFVKKDWIKKGAVVVDVGIHRSEDNKIIGDVVADAMESASFMTPVPKGVGPMTIAMLLSNTFDAYQQHLKG